MPANRNKQAFPTCVPRHLTFPGLPPVRGYNLPRFSLLADSVCGMRRDTKPRYLMDDDVEFFTRTANAAECSVGITHPTTVVRSLCRRGSPPPAAAMTYRIRRPHHNGRTRASPRARQPLMRTWHSASR